MHSYHHIVFFFFTACITPLDISFVFDSSSTVTKSGFDLMKKYASQLIESFAISAIDSHVGVVVAGKTPKVAFNFGQSYNSKKIQGEIKPLAYEPSSEGSLASALSLANQDLFSIKGRVRRGVPKIMVIVSDGNIPDSQKALLGKEGEALKSDTGTEIIVIGIGPRAANSAALKAIASAPKKQNFVQLGSFEDLASYSKQLKIAEQMCSGMFSVLFILIFYTWSNARLLLLLLKHSKTCRINLKISLKECFTRCFSCVQQIKLCFSLDPVFPEV